MNKLQTKKGLIVVVESNTSWGNPIGSITKILGKPGEISDTLFLATGKKEDPLLRDYVLCEARPEIRQTTRTCNNKPAFYQKINGLRLANANEKQAYTEGIEHINEITHPIEGLERSLNQK